MSKKDNKDRTNKQGEDMKLADYYKLKTKAVDDLVTANKENSPKVSEEELRKYRSGPKFKIAEWFKFLFIKWWFPAATCFFIMWGLGGYMDYLDNIVVLGIVLGMVTDILTNNALRFLEKTPGSSSKFIMFPKKRYMTFPLNILYSLLVLAAVIMTYNVINYTVITLAHLENTLPLGVEPILFGLFYLGYDSLFIAIKRTFQNIVADARRPAR